MWAVVKIRLVADALDVVESEERRYVSEMRTVRPILNKEIQHKLPFCNKNISVTDYEPQKYSNVYILICNMAYTHSHVPTL